MDRLPKVKLTLFLTVILGILVFAGYWYYTHSDYPVKSSPNDPSNFPYVPWIAVTDGQLAYSLEKKLDIGELVYDNTGVVPITKFETTPDDYATKVGISKMELSTEDFGSGIYKNISARPYSNIAYYQTKIGGEAYYLILQMWYNRDGNRTIVPLILPDNKVLKDGVITKYFAMATAPDTLYFLAPIKTYKDKETCIANMGKETGYCRWLYGGLGRYSRYVSVLDKWSKSGVVPMSISRYPTTFSWTPFYNDRGRE